MASMNVITVRYFASLRERLGRSEDQVEAAGLSCVADVLEPCLGRVPPDEYAGCH